MKYLKLFMAALLAMTMVAVGLGLDASHNDASAQTNGSVGVTVDRGGDRVTLRGGGAADDITIEGASGNDIIIRGDLTFNGSSRSSLRLDEPGVLRVFTRGGADDIIVEDVDVRRLVIAPGSRGDIVEIVDTTAGTTSLNGGRGSDTLILDNVSLGNDTIRSFETIDDGAPTGGGGGGGGGAFLDVELDNSTRLSFGTPERVIVRQNDVGNTTNVLFGFNDQGDNQDQLDLSAVDANANVPGNQAFTIVSRLTGVAGQVMVTGSPSSPDANVTQFLRADTTGDGVANLNITFVNSGLPITQINDNIVR